MSETPRTAGEEWKWRRREAIIRDDYTCQECGAEGGPKGDASLEVHHITPVSKGGSDDLENLETLCDDCHTALHAERRSGPPGDPQLKDETGRAHDENGVFTDKYPQSDIISAIESGGGLTATSEVADALGASRDTIYKKLSMMEEDGQLTSRKAGGIRVWSVEGGETDDD